MACGRLAYIVHHVLEAQMTLFVSATSDERTAEQRSVALLTNSGVEACAGELESVAAT